MMKNKTIVLITLLIIMMLLSFGLIFIIFLPYPFHQMLH